YYFHCVISTSFSFFFTVTASAEIYTLSLHDALPICYRSRVEARYGPLRPVVVATAELPADEPIGTEQARQGLSVRRVPASFIPRSEEHTSELQSRRDLVCRLLLEKKKKTRRSFLALV